MLFQLTVATVAGPIPTEQPGALDLYPPDLNTTVDVRTDHFRFTAPAPTFPLRLFAYSAFAPSGGDALAGSDAPVLFYCGNEGALETFYNASGAMFEHAKELRAHVVMAEHRFYGGSLPFGPVASFTPEKLALLSIEQALADYAEVIVALPRLLGCGAGRRRCDTVLFGGSYGGMLAAWHRFRYPHLSVGAIASGAPVDFYPDSGVQRRFEQAYLSTFEKHGGATGCGSLLEKALQLAGEASPAAIAAAGIRTCAPANASGEALQFYAAGAVSSLAMIDYPSPSESRTCVAPRAQPADQEITSSHLAAATPPRSSRRWAPTRCAPRARASRAARRCCARSTRRSSCTSTRRATCRASTSRPSSWARSAAAPRRGRRWARPTSGRFRGTTRRA
jgi:pimeloyl-ACP methyl ester carboxylesterase